ncbi:hypothetical protein [Desulfosediminicola sp.]
MTHLVVKACDLVHAYILTLPKVLMWYFEFKTERFKIVSYAKVA